jgi:diaminopropionate ammonia-lyase
MKDIEKIAYAVNQVSRKTALDKASTELFSSSVGDSVRKFHQSFPEYEPTPLARLPHLAHMLQVANIWIKDESYRFGLGAIHGLAYLVAHQLDKNAQELSFDLLNARSTTERLAGTTFVTATDGNHGRAVAWAAQQLGCNAVVYLPKGASAARYEAIKGHGAQVSIIQGNYDDAVQLAVENAQKHGWILVQDTAREGYEEIPAKIMQGYLTILHEALEQLKGEIPTHVFVQCGVGSLAAATQAYLFELFGDTRPIFAVVEPIRAACYYESMSARVRTPRKIRGNLDTIMAGLACGEPSTVAWKILRDYADVFVACPDYVAVRGMRILGNPLHGDDRVISGESGAVTLGLLAVVLEQASCRQIAEALSLDETSRVLLLSTEGDTDPSMYRKIVWGEGPRSQSLSQV